MSDYDPNKQSTIITYLDKDNLYGWSMSKYLPYSEFEWLKNFDKMLYQLMKKVMQDIYQKLILNILMNYINYIMIIHFLQKNLLLLMLYFQNIVKVLLINMK